MGEKEEEGEKAMQGAGNVLLCKFPVRACVASNRVEWERASAGTTGHGRNVGTLPLCQRQIPQAPTTTR